MTDSIILTKSNQQFGILSCNSKSRTFSNKTMSEYVLDSLKPSLKGRSVKDYMESEKRLKIDDAKSGVAIPNEMYRIDGDLHQRVINDEIERNILNLYAGSYPELEDSYRRLNPNEAKLLREKLFNHYISNRLDGLLIGKNIENFSMNGIKRKDGETIGDYYNSSIDKIKTDFSEKILRKMNQAIQMRLLDSQFVDALTFYDVNNKDELPFVVPESDDVDVLEKINIYLLSEFRSRLSTRDGFLLLGGDKDRANDIANAIMRLIASVRNYIRDDKVSIDNKFVKRVLTLAFPSYDKLIIIQTPLPEFVTEKIANTPGFQNVDPNIIWYYVQRYAVSGGVLDIQMYKRNDQGEVFDKIADIGDKLTPENQRKTNVLRNRMQDKFKQSSRDAFSPKTMGKVVIYEMDGCPWCVKATQMLDNKKIKYKKILFQTVPKEKLIDISQSKDGSLSFPIVVVDDSYIGGFTELKKLMS